MFIAIYGINNLGKSTQAKKLVERLIGEGHSAEYIKYPIYNLEPTGSMLNEYLRGGNPRDLNPREAQTLYVLNRFHYQPILMEKLQSGIHVIAEDYVHTGIAWGISAGVCSDYLHRINEPLVKEDLAFLFDGERFLEATEQTHKHETNHELMHKVRVIHQELGDKHGWHRIGANQSIEDIHQQLWEKVQQHINISWSHF